MMTKHLISRWIVLCSFSFLSWSVSLAQSQPDTVFCRAVLPTGAELDSVVARHQRFQDFYDPGGGIPALAGLQIIPVQIHIVRLDNGTGGIMEASVLAELATVNMLYQGAGLIFVACEGANFINSTAFSTVAGFDEGDNLAATYNIPNVLNLYFVENAYFDVAMTESACGWATFTGDSDEYVLMDNDCATNGSTLAHEIGHYFDLFHTHEDFQGAELVDGSNCMIAGDLMCSTPADPNLSGVVDGACTYTGMATDANNQMYMPDPTNIMSYSLKTCRTNFTAEQLAKAAFTAANARSYVSVISCPADVNEYVDASCNFVVPDYRPLLTYNLDCTLTDTIQDPPPGTMIGGIGFTLVTMTVVDANMDMSTCTFNLIRLDSIAPSIGMVPPDTILTNANCLGVLPDYRDPTTVVDNCDLLPFVQQSPPPGTIIGGVGAQQTVYIIASDASGNIDSLPIPVTIADPNPDGKLNCLSLNLAVNQLGQAEFILEELVPGANCTELYTILIETEYGAQVYRDGDEMRNSLVSFPACNYLTQRLKVTIIQQSDGSSCWGYLTFKQTNGPVFIPRFPAHVFCHDPLVESGDILDVKPLGFLPCGEIIEGTFVADWIIPFPCESDTAKVILREYEAFDKLGRRGTITDTITVSKLPQIITIPLGTDLRNLSCKEQDTLYCGENDLTRDSLTPVGPYLLVEEFPFNPALDIDGDGVNCDTIYFCYLKDGELINAFEDDDKCGLQIHKDYWEFGDVCNRQYKVVVELKQDCYKTPVLLDCSPIGSSNVEQIAAGYYRCEFWVTDLDTTPPLLAAKIIGEYECLVLDTNDLLDGNLFQNFVPLVSTTTHDCIAQAEIPRLCVYDDWSGIKTVKATVEGIGTYILQPTDDACILFDIDEDPISFGGGFGEEFLDSLTAMFGDSLAEVFLQQIRIGTCYRSDTKIPLPKRELPYLIIYEAMDSCHIIGRDTALIQVKDKVQPVAVADKGVTVSLSDKKIWVDAVTFDEGSWDNCGIEFVLARRADWQEACVDLCYNNGDSCLSKEEALCWIWTDGHDTLWIPELERDKHCDEVEAFYQKNLDWLCTDGGSCGALVYNSWIYDLIKYATLECKNYDHLDEKAFDGLFRRAAGNPKAGDQFKITDAAILAFLDSISSLIDLDSILIDSNHIQGGFLGLDLFKCQEVLKDFCIDLFGSNNAPIFDDNLLIQFLLSGGCAAGFDFLGTPSDIFLPLILPDPLQDQVFDEWRAIGGGWSDQVVFSCEDACGPVTVEILVMDYWCNWTKAWTNVWVEDKTPVNVAKDVVEEETISCKSYKDKRYTYPNELHPVSLDYVVEQAKMGEQDAYDLLDAVFGGYCKAWMDPYGNYVDNEGVEIDCDITFQDSICDCTSYVKQVRVYDEHLGYLWKDSLVTECFYEEDEIDFQKGIVVVNCEENVHCEQEVWCEFDHCGQGYIFRKFKIWQGCPDSFYLDHNVPDSLKHPVDTIYRHQRIWVQNACVLNKYMFDVPYDTTVYSCNIDYDGAGNVIGDAGPENTGMATYKFDDAMPAGRQDCRIVGIGHSDKVFKVVGGDAACYKIIRTWYFADWCGTGGTPVNGNWWYDHELVLDSCVQKIIVIDTMPPVCTITGPVEDGGAIAVGACAFNLEVEVDVTDPCVLQDYYWELREISNPEGVEVVDYGNGLLAGVEADLRISSSDLPYGSYKLEVIAHDACRNEGKCTYTFDVVSVKKPSPVCVTSLTARLTPWDSDGDGVADTAKAVVWAGEFDSSSEPACQDTAIEFRIELITGDSTDLSAAGDVDSLALGCNDAGSHMVRLWVISLPSDTRDYCDVVLIVQSDGNGCESSVTEHGMIKEVGTIGNVSKAMDRSMLAGDQSKVVGPTGRPLEASLLTQAYELEQNIPNPFQEETSIGFVLPQAMKATLTVYDVTGRVIRAVEGDFSPGFNQVQFRQTDLGVNGVLYYHLKAGAYAATRRMVLID